MIQLYSRTTAIKPLVFGKLSLYCIMDIRIIFVLGICVVMVSSLPQLYDRSEESSLEEMERGKKHKHGKHQDIMEKIRALSAASPEEDSSSEADMQRGNEARSVETSDEDEDLEERKHKNKHGKHKELMEKIRVLLAASSEDDSEADVQRGNEARSVETSDEDEDLEERKHKKKHGRKHGHGEPDLRGWLKARMNLDEDSE